MIWSMCATIGVKPIVGKMWKESVAISDQIYESCKPVIFVCRVLGLFPVVIYSKANRLYLKCSPSVAIYSCTLAVTISKYLRLMKIC